MQKTDFAVYGSRAERFVVGAAMLSPDAASLVAAAPDELFTNTTIRRYILPAIRKAYAKGATSPAVIASEIAMSGGEVDERFLSDCISMVDSPQLVSYHLSTLRDLAVVRRFRNLLERIENDFDGPPLELIEKEVSSVSSLLGGANNVKRLVDAASNLDEYNSPPRVSTGIEPIDDVLKIRGGNLIFVAATPGVGKTSLAVQIAHNAAMDGLSVLFTSLEMSAEEIARRMGARMGARSPEEVRECISALDVYYDTSSTPSALRERVRSIAPDLVIVDYIGLMSGDDRNGNRALELANISRSLKVMAMAFNVPVIALSQLNRRAADGDPQLHHLRDSGALEADADAVILIRRDDMATWLNLAKHRHGKVGEWPVTFDPERCQFT